MTIVIARSLCRIEAYNAFQPTIVSSQLSKLGPPVQRPPNSPSFSDPQAVTPDNDELSRVLSSGSLD